MISVWASVAGLNVARLPDAPFSGRHVGCAVTADTGVSGGP